MALVYNPAVGAWVDANAGAPLQGGGGGSLQGSSQNIQGSPNTIQLTADPNSFSAPSGGGKTPVSDPAAVAAAAEVARVAAARGDVSNRIQQIKDIYNSRYGKVDKLAGEQTTKLNDRFGNESKDLLGQIDTQNQGIGAAHAAGGTYDSSYRANNQDTVTHEGQSQIRDLGQELQDNVAKVGQWLSKSKAGLNAGKSQYDSVLASLADETNPDTLLSLRNQLDAQIAKLQASEADYNTNGQNAQALEAVAPSSKRVVQLKTNLQSILAGSSSPSMKLAIGNALIQNSDLTPEEQQRLLLSFQGDVGQTQQDQQVA